MYKLEAIFPQNKFDVKIESAEAQFAEGIACGHRRIGDGAKARRKGTEIGPAYIFWNEVGILGEDEIRFVFDQIVICTKISKGGLVDAVAVLGAQGRVLSAQVDVPECMRKEVSWHRFDKNTT